MDRVAPCARYYGRSDLGAMVPPGTTDLDKDPASKRRAAETHACSNTLHLRRTDLAEALARTCYGWVGWEQSVRAIDLLVGEASGREKICSRPEISSGSGLEHAEVSGPLAALHTALEPHMTCRNRLHCTVRGCCSMCGGWAASGTCLDTAGVAEYGRLVSGRSPWMLLRAAVCAELHRFAEYGVGSSESARYRVAVAAAY